jgi:hypothetical protein
MNNITERDLLEAVFECSRALTRFLEQPGTPDGTAASARKARDATNDLAFQLGVAAGLRDMGETQ